MKPEVDLQARLEQAAKGKAPKPRGHSVTATERAAVAPFAKACLELVESSLHTRNPFEQDEDLLRIAAPSAALPPLP